MAATSECLVATVEDYLALPEDGPRFELIDGLLTMAPAPNYRHQIVLGEVHHVIKCYLKTHPIGQVVFAPCDVFLDEKNVLQPDLIFTANDRRHLISKRGLEGGPSLVVEVLSAGTALRDRGVKREVYAAAGVEECWLIDLGRETVEVFRFAAHRSRPVQVLLRHETLQSPLLPGLAISLEDIFGA